MLYAYIDANILIEFRQLRDIPWREVLGQEAVLVISRSTFEELDKFKDRPGPARSKRQRAAQTARDLDVLLFPDGRAAGPVNLQSGVRVDYDDDRVPQSIYDENSLDAVLGDDRLIAHALAARVRAPDIDVCIVAADGGARRTALRRGLRVVAPPEQFRLQEEPDPEQKELRDLRKRVAELEARSPRLSLRFAGDEGVFRCVLPRSREPVDEHVERQLRKLREMHPPYDAEHLSARDQLMERHFGPPAPKVVDAYHGARDKFLEQAQQVLSKIIAHRNLLDRHIRVDLRVSNDGTAPGDGVKVQLTLPPNVSAARSLPKSSAELPKAPTRPHSDTSESRYLEDMFAARHGLLGLRGLRIEPAPKVRIHDWEIEKGQGNTALHFVGTVRHQAIGSRLRRLYLILPSFHVATSFHIEYLLHAHNTTAPARGTLHVVVEKAEKLSRLALSVDEPSVFREPDEMPDAPHDRAATDDDEDES